MYAISDNLFEGEHTMKTNDQKITGNGEKEPQCRVTSFKKNTTKKEVLPESKINRYKSKDFHLFIDLVHMLICFRANGKTKLVSADKKGIHVPV